MDNNLQTIIKQYSKECGRNYLPEFYSYVYTILNNLIQLDTDKNFKFTFINYLMFERVIIFFKDKYDNLQVGRLAYCQTRDENFLPIDITARTIDGTRYELIKGDYVMLYNPIPIDYLGVKLYKIPMIFQNKDTKILRNVKDFIKRVFQVDDEVCTIINDGWDQTKTIQKIDLNIDYITDKLLDENESIKEDIDRKSTR